MSNCLAEDKVCFYCMGEMCQYYNPKYNSTFLEENTNQDEYKEKSE